MGNGGPQPAPSTASLRRLCAVTEEAVDGRRTLTLRPRRRVSGTHIIYPHGGTCINELVRPQWWMVAELIRRTGATVTVKPARRGASGWPGIGAPCRC